MAAPGGGHALGGSRRAGGVPGPGRPPGAPCSSSQRPVAGSPSRVDTEPLWWRRCWLVLVHLSLLGLSQPRPGPAAACLAQGGVAKGAAWPLQSSGPCPACPAALNAQPHALHPQVCDVPPGKAASALFGGDDTPHPVTLGFHQHHKTQWQCWERLWGTVLQVFNRTVRTAPSPGACCEENARGIARAGASLPCEAEPSLVRRFPGTGSGRRHRQVAEWGPLSLTGVRPHLGRISESCLVS